MTTFLLIRHGLTDAVDRWIAGTAPGVPLNAAGQAQARALADLLAGVPLAAIVSSPVQRARETADAIARPHGLRVEERAGMSEVEFGTWTGAALQELNADEAWMQFNQVRSLTPPPGGELMVTVQQRAMETLLALAARHDSATVAVVSHGDVIRAALMFCLGMPLDLIHRLEVSPCRISVVQLQAGLAPIVRQVNGDTATLPA